MPDPLQDRQALSDLLTRVADAARRYLARVDELPAGEDLPPSGLWK